MAVTVGDAWMTVKREIDASTALSPATFFTSLALAVACTCLSPATFFTVLALALAFYYVISGFFARPPRRSVREFEAPEPLSPPVQLGEVSEEDLAAYSGEDPKKPLLMAIKGQIYDVTQSWKCYGPGGRYALYAGKDASRAIAKMSFEKEDLTGDISGLGTFELETLQDWEYKFMSKYVKVGTIKKIVPVTAGSSDETSGRDTVTTAEPTEGTAPKEAEHIAETVENGHVDHVTEAERDAKTKENGSTEHGAEAATDVKSEAKELN